MITVNVTNRYNQTNTDVDIKDNEESDNEDIRNIFFNHTHPQKLEDFFIKNESAIWTVDQSTLDKVQMLIKDIEYFNQFNFAVSFHRVFTKIKDEDGDVDEEATQGYKEFSNECEGHNIQVLKDDVTLLYNIFSYTHTAFNLQDCKNKPLVKTISELAFATLKTFEDKGADEISDLIATFLTSSNILQLTDLINTLKTMQVNNVNSGTASENKVNGDNVVKT